MKQQQAVLELQLTPFNVLLRAVLGQLQEKDKYSIFAQPVSTKEVCVDTHTQITSTAVLWVDLLSGGLWVTNRSKVSCRFRITWTISGSRWTSPA